MTYQEAYEKLEKYNQTHLLKYSDELTDEGKKSLLSQIELLDLSVIGHNNDCADEKGKIEPLGALTIDEINNRKNEFEQVGIDAIKKGKIGAILLAGGQGTRLGFDKPKGMYNIGVNKELYIFECLINNLKKVVDKAEAWIPLFIMTSEKNYDDTREFLKEKNYFGYKKEYITFFIQDMAPSTDFSGRILMENHDKISMSPNGNGGWFTSFARAGLLSKIKDAGIEWLNVFAVDNVLQKMADPVFIGATIACGCESGSKVVSKAAPDEKVGVLCLEDGKPSIVEYYEMTDEMIQRRENDGRLSYNYGVILNYLFKVKNLEQIIDEEMPLHIAKKKIPYMNESGNFIQPSKENGYKYETLVLDMVKRQDSCLAFEVERKNEFAPVKNAEGIDSVESARKLLTENGITI